MNTSSFFEEELRGPTLTLDSRPEDMKRDLDAVVPTAHAQLDLHTVGDMENDLYDTQSKRNFNNLLHTEILKTMRTCILDGNSEHRKQVAFKHSFQICYFCRPKQVP